MLAQERRGKVELELNAQLEMKAAREARLRGEAEAEHEKILAVLQRERAKDVEKAAVAERRKVEVKAAVEQQLAEREAELARELAVLEGGGSGAGAEAQHQQHQQQYQQRSPFYHEAPAAGLPEPQKAALPAFTAPRV
jgi:hypothetical protein